MMLIIVMRYRTRVITVNRPLEREVREEVVVVTKKPRVVREVIVRDERPKVIKEERRVVRTPRGGVKESRTVVTKKTRRR